MLETQIDQAKDMLNRIRKQRELRKSGLTYANINKEYPSVPVTFAEIESWHSSVKELLVDMFGSNSPYITKWTAITNRFDLDPEDPEFYYVQCLDAQISLINQATTAYKIHSQSVSTINTTLDTSSDRSEAIASKIRKTLVLYFSDDEINSLCFDNFIDVYNTFSAQMTKTSKIQILLEHCVQRNSLQKCVQAIQLQRPDISSL